MTAPLLKNKWAAQWVLAMLVVLMVGLLVSRALVSLSSVLIVLPFFFHRQLDQRTRVLLVAVLLMLLPVIVSGLWSENHSLWWNSVAVKLPLVTMLLGIGSVYFSAERKTKLVYLYLLLISLGCIWSFSQYLFHPTVIQAAYLQAKTLPTPADNDHIRFSWMVVIAVVLGFHSLLTAQPKTTRYLLAACLVLLVVYLHVLAAKTGLVCLYTGSGIYIMYLIIVQKKRKTGLLLLAVCAVAAFTCYQTMPTLRNRVQYVLYDFSNYSSGRILPGYSDASRWLSMKAGYQLTAQNPIQGVGFGDMLAAVDQWHQLNHPASLAYERFLPANEWLIYGTGSGLPGVLCFTVGFVLLLYRTTSRNIFSVIVTTISLVPFLFDDTLEGQTGILVLAFIAFFGQQKLSSPHV
ncbi:MAG: hypothetical protein EPO58_06290 [Chitinophagaceae bacterium]|nr:MAG: hypothetical protein EPO58_06290 [Chitinophagaceae bacterium]